MEKTPTFDLGLYAFRRQVRGPLCHKDEADLQDGQVIAVLHPMQQVDETGMYVFGIDRLTGATKVIVRNNLRFRTVASVKWNPEPQMDKVQTLHAKLNAALNFMKESKQLAL